MIPISFATCAIKYKHLAEGLGDPRRPRSPLGETTEDVFCPSSCAPPGTGGLSQPSRPGTARFTKPLQLKKHRSARCPRVAALVQLHPPKHRPGQLVAHIALGITWGGLVGVAGTTGNGPFARARQPFRAPPYGTQDGGSFGGGGSADPICFAKVP
jgi:hypothetical protein